MTDISVIICTHNPREDYLRRVLDALKVQTLPKQQWELLLIDNACTEVLTKSWDLSWHELARHIREDDLGLTPARLRGIKESKGEVLVFVDDDNVLAPDYLTVSTRIESQWPQIGVWGGQKHPKFEIPPPDWSRPYWRMLAIVEIDKDGWSNQGGPGAWPCGAGMCVRRSVADKYAMLVQKHPLRSQLGRRGTSLMSGDDTDLVCTAYESGYGSGLFVALHLEHLIAKERLSEDHFLKLHESMACSDILVEASQNALSAKPSFLGLVINVVTALLHPTAERRMRFAKLRGERMGRRMVKQLRL